MEKRSEKILFVLLTFLIPALLIAVDVIFLTDILLTVFALVWMGFCLIVLAPSGKRD